MKIIQLGKDKEFQAGCVFCKTTFSYTLDEVYRDQNGKLQNTIKCPSCNQLILGLNYKEI